MRGLATLLLVGTLAGCENDRSFDKRYDETANQIEQRGAKLDAEASGVEANSADRSEAP